MKWFMEGVGTYLNYIDCLEAPRMVIDKEAAARMIQHSINM